MPSGLAFRCTSVLPARNSARQPIEGVPVWQSIVPGSGSSILVPLVYPLACLEGTRVDASAPFLVASTISEKANHRCWPGWVFRRRANVRCHFHECSHSQGIPASEGNRRTLNSTRSQSVAGEEARECFGQLRLVAPRRFSRCLYKSV